MKKTDLGKVQNSLATLSPRVTVPEDVAARARAAIERMLAV
jgi:quinolinate synthase